MTGKNKAEVKAKDNLTHCVSVVFACHQNLK